METALNLMTGNGWLLLAAPGLPLGWALLLAVTRSGILLQWSPWMALPALVTALLVPTGAFVELPWAMLQARCGLDDTGRVFLLFTSLLWLLSTLDACSSMTAKPRQRAFFFFTLLAMSGNFGLIVAQDLFSFYVSFALMSFSSYGLVVHYRGEEALRAGRIFIILVVIGEILVFTALVMIHRAIGDPLLSAVTGMKPEPLSLALLFAGFGIKAGAVPLHVWLPLAHPAAPTPSSAVLSGAMIKAGLLGWLRFLPLGASALPEWGALFMGAGLFAAFGGVGVGLTQRNPKTVLAYSSISQMGLMTTGVGLALALPERASQVLAAVAVYACHHGLTKGALFLGVGMADAVPRHSRRHAWVLAGMGWSALTLAGLPPTGGFLAKGLLKDMAGLLPGPWYDVLNVLLPLTAWGTMLLMFHFLSLVMRRSGSGEVGAGRWLSWHAILACVAVAVWMLPESTAWRAHALDTARWWSALRPAGLACLTALLFKGLQRASGRSLTVFIPPGDILAAMRFFRQPLGKVQDAVDGVSSVLDQGLSLRLYKWCVPHHGRFTDVLGKRRLQRMEEGLIRFATAGTLVILVLVLLFFFGWRPFLKAG